MMVIVRIPVYATLLIFVWFASQLCSVGTEAVVPRILSALERGVKFMRNEIARANLDSIFCVRKMAEQLESYLKNEPKVFSDVASELEKLSVEAHQTADLGLDRLTGNATGDDIPYVEAVGYIMNRIKKPTWYPSLNTSTPSQPVPCYTDYDLNVLGNCFREIGQSWSSSLHPCNISHYCVKYMSKPNRSGYYLTHEVLYFLLLEEFNCVGKISDKLRIEFCSDVLRDATETANHGYQPTFLDLFFEQIGFCGIWGFREFNKPEWLRIILDRQQPSGCYADESPKSDTNDCYATDEVEIENHLRIKRSEKMLENGCKFHETGVALLALAVNLRFEMEKIYKIKEEETSALKIQKSA